MPHPLRCPECGRTLGVLRRYHDQRGRARQRLTLERNVDTRWRWFRLHAECACGELVRLPEATDVVHRN